MNTKKIIPCLDIKDGRVVKGVRFVDIKDAGDPLACAARYEQEGADELVFLDISATEEGRATVADLVRRVARSITLPLTVGGGIRTADDCQKILDAGAAKISINSAAVRRKELIAEIAARFGKERLVLAVDVCRNATGASEVVIQGGKVLTGLDAVQWAREGEKLGAGAILLTSKDADGAKNGYDIPVTKAVADAVNIPVIASGGCGSLSHFAEVFRETRAEGALAASLFHFRELTVGQVKDYLRQQGFAVTD